MSHVTLKVTRLHWLCPQTFEVRFERPAGFAFIPGQKIDLGFKGGHRTYTLINAADDDHLAICVRRVGQGHFTPMLSATKPGDCYQATSAYGYFAFQPAQSQAIFVATGTGIAPFVSFARSGAKGFYLLHGVFDEEQLYYQDELESAALKYVPCLSGDLPPTPSFPHGIQGHVTDYLGNALPAGTYDFYLCGRNEMIADTTKLIDQHFEGSRVFAEMFY